MVEEVKLKQNLISELKKENIEFEAKLKQQQNLYEAVRSDRNLYSKNLIEAQDEMQEADIQKLKNNLLEADNTCKSLQQEIKKLETIIEKGEREMERQRKELDEVINERDILGTQLIRRNEELALLYEKIKIQESTLKKGEIQYRNRLEEIKAQKEGIGQLKYDLCLADQQ